MKKVMDALLQRAAGQDASDLHLSEQTPPVVRVAGKLRSLPLEKGWEKYNLTAMTEEILTETQQQELQEKGQCDFAYALSDGLRFRFNVYRSGGNLTAAIRLIPEKIISCQELGLPESVRNFAYLKSGLVLITGVTGSGKSTTLAAIIQEINLHRTCHILTLEDPIEYRFVPAQSLIHQRETGADTASFAEGLRAALRQDPDVIMVGEMRDAETIAIAVTAAETGHLVFSTLHTRGAAETVDRIIDSFSEQKQKQIRIQLAESLQAVASQQLLPGKEGGRAVAVEVMRMTPAIRNLIRKGETGQMHSYIQTGAQYGMQTMESAVNRLRKEGKIE